MSFAELVDISDSLLIWARRGGFLLNCSEFRSVSGRAGSVTTWMWVGWEAAPAGFSAKRMTPCSQETHSRVQELGNYTNNNNIHNRLIKDICCSKQTASCAPNASCLLKNAQIILKLTASYLLCTRNAHSSSAEVCKSQNGQKELFLL